jgi:hypothetical protein
LGYHAAGGALVPDLTAMDQDVCSTASEYAARTGAGRVESFLISLGITPSAGYAGVCECASVQVRVRVWVQMRVHVHVRM